MLHVSLAHLVNLGTRVKAVTDTAIKYVSLANGTIGFYTSADGSGTAAFTVNLPAELVLDTDHTAFEPAFAWSAQDYPGSTNPNLDGKPVIVFAVKTTPASGSGETITYMFMDVATLVDTYTAADNSMTVSGYTLAVKVSPDAGNALTLASNGLKVDISGKADKVANATAGNLAGLDANGNLTDSGLRMATDTEVNTALDAIFPSNS